MDASNRHHRPICSSDRAERYHGRRQEAGGIRLYTFRRQVLGRAGRLTAGVPPRELWSAPLQLSEEEDLRQRRHRDSGVYNYSQIYNRNTLSPLLQREFTHLSLAHDKSRALLKS